MVGFHRSAVAGPLLAALNVGHLQTQDLGQGLTGSAAPVESQPQLRVAAVNSRAEIYFGLERKNLCPLSQLCRWRLSLANWDLDQTVPRLI